MEEERIRQKNAKIPGIVPIQDLLNGEYWRRKESERLKSDSKTQKMRKMKRDLKKASQPTEE